MQGWGFLCRCIWLVAAVLAATSASAQSPAPGNLPAVDGYNGKIAGVGGAKDGNATGFADLNLTIPVGHRYGVQFDAGLGSHDGHFVHVTGAHLFWRDPSHGLAGIEIVHGRSAGPNFSLLRIGLEGEYYYRNWTFQLRGGFQTLDIERGGYVDAFVSWYPDPNLRIRAGGQLAHGARSNRFIGSAEYLFATSGTTGFSAFLDGSVGQDGFTNFFVGLRLHLGRKAKTLIRRHREDDPEGLVIPTIKDLPSGTGGTPTVTNPSLPSPMGMPL